MTILAGQKDVLSIAFKAMHDEADAILCAAGRLDGNVTLAVELLHSNRGKVIVTGVGKSGLVGQKLAATLCSTGTQAVFLHAAEAFHGDLGLYTPGDPTILISKGGTTTELLQLVPILREFESPLIGIIGNTHSPLAAQVDILFDSSVRSEADPNDLAPTSSSTVAMALGDALAVALLTARGFSASDFARFHPGGQLGKSLRSSVYDLLHGGDEVAWVSPTSPLKQVVIAMTERPLGAACVCDDKGHLRGLITDGDLRRALLSHDDIRTLLAGDIMTSNPVTINPTARVSEAVRLMEDRPRQISVLPVRDEATRVCLGLIRIHDIYSDDRKNRGG